MQVNNVNSYQQNFGMAIHANENVINVLKSRVKTNKELSKLNSIVANANSQNTVDINLMLNPDGKTLSANVFTPKSSNIEELNYFRQYSENWFTKLSGGVVGFIEKVTNKADKAAKKIENMQVKRDNDVFKKLV